MSTRRTPLSSNPNAANSPLRGAAASALLKAKRSHATVQREEAYGQPPPLKKQIIDHSRASKSQATATRPVARPTVRERAVQPAVQPLNRYNDKEQEDIEAWTRHHRARFPKIVFYFESVPDEVRSKLAKQVASLGAREEKFFSINITHVITTRPIPPAERGREESAETSHEEPEPEEQPQTINPSLLDRSSDARRRYLLDPNSRRAPSHAQDDAVKRSKPARNTDVLSKAREMGKKIWALEKLQRMLQILLEDGHAANVGYVPKAGQSQNRKIQPYRNGEDLQQLLQKERLNGPSDRDPTVVSKELHFFKGPYIYIYDIDEKQKPIMVREYAKVSNKHDGEWPQFRSVANGRCPFVEEPDHMEKESRKQQREQRAQAKEAKEKEKAARSLAQAPVLQPPLGIPHPKPVTGKRTLAEMEEGANRGRGVLNAENAAESSVPFASKHVAYPLQNAFTSRHGHGRLFAGEPVASGVQPSNITSAIRSTMISSTSGLNGAKAGTSKELHGLQRKVLQKSAPGSHELSSRRLTELSLENPSSRSISATGRTASRRMETVDEDPKTHKAVATQAPPKKSKAEMKPGYCENCGDKFDDFDDHIVSRKHRRFAENNDNWHELDSLLQQLARVPKNWSPEEW